MEQLIGTKIKKIYISDYKVVFKTNKGDFGFGTYGDCCSSTYIHDFIGVENLLKNGEVKMIENIFDIDKEHTEIEKVDAESTSWYGVRIVTEDPDFGEVSAVLSFRNESNGYYGGSLEPFDSLVKGLKEIKGDWLND